jgi:hypothetical protein
MRCIVCNDIFNNWNEAYKIAPVATIQYISYLRMALLFLESKTRIKIAHTHTHAHRHMCIRTHHDTHAALPASQPVRPSCTSKHTLGLSRRKSATPLASRPFSKTILRLRVSPDARAPRQPDDKQASLRDSIPLTSGHHLTKKWTLPGGVLGGSFQHFCVKNTFS